MLDSVLVGEIHRDLPSFLGIEQTKAVDAQLFK